MSKSAQMSSSKPGRSNPGQVSPVGVGRRAALAASLLVTLVGLGAAAYLTHLHVLAHTDANYTPACDISATWRCSKVAMSSYSIFLRVPVAVWALLGYSAFLFFLVWGLRREKRVWPTGLYWLLSAGTLLTTIVLAVVAEFVVRALCLGCVIMYGVNVLLFLAATWLLAQDRGALRRDLAGIFRNRPVMGLAGVGLVTAIALIVAYPKYWEIPLQAECGGLPAGIAGDGSCWIGARVPQLEITEFSDYRCPFCRRAHVRLRQLVQKHPNQIRLIHKHFPLDMSCNPLLTKQLHDGACLDARMAYCAGVQGQFWAMNDRLFSLPENDSTDPARLARETGIQVAPFLACLNSAEASAYVERDIQEGLRLHIHGTPTFLINGRTYTGSIPDSVLRPYLENGAKP
jgi:uncharacterized membrane protein